jgi:hypothetical protein
VLATVITFARNDAQTLEVVIEAALRERDLRIDREAAARVCAALRAWRGRGFFVVPINLTDAERDAARICWEALALGYPQIDEAQYIRVIQKLLVG